MGGSGFFDPEISGVMGPLLIAVFLGPPCISSPLKAKKKTLQPLTAENRKEKNVRHGPCSSFVLCPLFG